ncbi:hypothetical protein ABPG74_008953 [Tetrahymena malaccensis]
MAQTEREQALETLRQKALQDSDALGSRQRFALFSQPPPLAVGDDSIYKHTLVKKDENGKVPTQPRNMSIKAPQQGKSKSSFFSLLGFTTIGDPYIEPDRIQRQYELQKKKLNKQDQVFKPASSYKTIVTSSFEHLPDYDNKPKTVKDADGKVITQPKNITTSVTVKQLLKPYPHMVEPFDREREFRKRERDHHIQLLKDKPQFKTYSHGGYNFSPDKKAFGYDGTFPEKKVRDFSPNIFKHDNPFKPSNPTKSGLDGFISKYPEYKPDPIRQPVRQDHQKQKDSFKINSPTILTRPTPSITIHPVNIRKEIANMSSFK